ANVQFRDDRQGVPRLMEVNPRIPGTIGLTVAAGVNMPYLAVKLALDEPLGAVAAAREGTEAVRYWSLAVIDGNDGCGWQSSRRSCSTSTGRLSRWSHRATSWKCCGSHCCARPTTSVSFRVHAASFPSTRNSSSAAAWTRRRCGTLANSSTALKCVGRSTRVR